MQKNNPSKFLQNDWISNGNIKKLKSSRIKSNSNKSAFTLVELIVVIIILAILGTIVFISLQGYSAQSRDSARLSDLSSIKSSLELYQLDAGKYPLPTNGLDITYSGAVVWNQGTFGETVYSNVKKLDKIPLDSLIEKEYTYSVTSKRNEYEISGIIEGDLEAINNFVIQQTNAGEILATALVLGNYNGQMAQSLSGTICNILSLPTIVASDVTTSTDLIDIVNNGSLVYNGYKNLPSSFSGSKFKQDGGFVFTPNKLLAYTDNNNCSQLISKTSPIARVTLLKGLQNSYEGTILENVGEIKNILDLDINITNPSQNVINFASTIVNNNLGAEITIENNQSCEQIITQTQADTLNTIWQNGDMDIYRNLDWNALGAWINPNTDGPFTKSQWCNDVYIVDTYTSTGVTSDLVSVYNAMNKLEELWYINADLSTQLSYLSLLNDLILKQNGDNIAYNSSVLTMTNLKGLYLVNYSLSSVPTEVYSFSNLTHLGIYGCPGVPSTGCGDVTSLSSQIGTLTNLRVLDFQNNKISTIPAEIGNLTNLWRLIINGNQLTSLPSQLGNLHKLINLYLGGNTSLGNLGFDFNNTTPNRTQGGMTIGGNGTNIVITGTF